MTAVLGTPTTRPPADAAEQMRADRDQVIAALIDTQDRLAALGALMQVPTDTLDEAQVLDRMLVEALALTGSDAVALWIDGNEREALRPDLAPSAAAGLRGVLAAPEPAAHPGSGACTTVAVPGSAGARLVAARTGADPYSTGDLRMVETVGAAAGKLVRLVRLHRDGVRRATVEREHRLASELAQGALPTRVPAIAGLEVFARCDQADITGGDLLVFAEVGDVLWFAVGDVAGKGLPAATVMTRAVSALRVAFLTHGHDDPAGAVAAVSAELGDYLDGANSFVTVVLGAVRAGREVHLCNAGQSPVAYRGPGGGGPGGELTAIGPSCAPLGVDFGLPVTRTLPFGPGALLVLGTDGLAEQSRPDGELLGYDRLLASFAGHGRSAAGIGDAVFDTITRFAAGTPASDDRTLVVLRSSGEGR